MSKTCVSRKRYLQIALRILAAALIVVVAGACGQPPGSGDRLSIATGSSGGVYSVYGGGLANQITQNIEGYEATAEVTSASVDNMLLVGDKSSDMAFVLADAAADGVRGEGSFEKPVQARALAQLYTAPTQVVVRADSGIETIEDLRGKTVSLGDPNSSTELLARRIFAAAGVNPDRDLKPEYLSVDESADALSDGSIDAFFWGGGVPTGAVTNVATSEDIALIPTAEHLDELEQKYPGVYTESSIPSGSYPNVEEEVPAVGARNFLVVHEDMEESLAHDITRVLFEQKRALVNVHPEAKNLNLQDAQNVAPVQLHSGAKRYYEEQG